MMPRQNPESMNPDNSSYAQQQQQHQQQQQQQHQQQQHQQQQYARRGEEYRFYTNQGLQGQMNQAMVQPVQVVQRVPHNMPQYQQYMEVPGGHAVLPQGVVPQQQQGVIQHVSPGQFFRSSSPTQGVGVGGMPMQYHSEMSPSMARMHMGGGGAMAASYPLSAGASTPTSPAVQGYEGGSQSHPNAAVSQAEREEELLLNLLIARRQRGRVEGSSGRNQPSLSEELMRMRQQQARQRGNPNLPPIPGMPPLMEGMGSMQGVGPPGMPHQHPQQYQNIQVSASTEIHERIDRSPGRAVMDARSQQEMLDFSIRGHGMKRGFPFAMPYGHMGGDPMGADVPKKKRKHKKKPADMPRRPLSAYNVFFSEERERILKEIGGDTSGEGPVDDREGDEEAVKEETGEGGDESSSSPKPKALTRPLIPSEKKRRPHRKTHGKISFQELARMVGDRWKNLSEERRQYYQNLAKEDMKRQKAAMEEYYAKQNAAKSLKKGGDDEGAAKESDEDDDEEEDVEAEEVEGEDDGEAVISDASPAEDANKHAIQA